MCLLFSSFCICSCGQQSDGSLWRGCEWLLEGAKANRPSGKPIEFFLGVCVCTSVENDDTGKC